MRILRQEGYKIVHLIPGDSDFDYRQDLASRVPTPLVRPAFAPSTPSGAIVPVSTGNAAAGNVTDSGTVASISPVAVDGASTLSSPEGSLLKSNRANAASRLRALELKKQEEKKELAKRERAKRLAALPAPSPKRKPKRRKTASVQSKPDVTELRGSQPINSEPVQSPNDEQAATITSSIEPLPKKKKKKRFRLLRKLFTSTDDRPE